MVPALVSVPHPFQMHNLFHINTEQTVTRTATEHTSESKNMDPLAKRQNQNRRPNPSTPAVNSSIIHTYHFTSLQLESLHYSFFKSKKLDSINTEILLQDDFFSNQKNLLF